MNHEYTVTRAVFDGTKGASNPAVRIIGTVDGFQYPFATTWSQVWSAYNVGGTGAVQQVFSAIMLGTLINYRLIAPEPIPAIPRFFGEVPSAPAGNATAGFVTLNQAMVGSWTA